MKIASSHKSLCLVCAVLFCITIASECFAVNCASIAPSSSPSTNRANIQNCLDTQGQAILAPGLFEVDGTIVVPNNATLKGGTTWRELRLVNNTKQKLIQTYSNTRVGFLNINGNNLVSGAHSAVIHVSGSKAFIDNNKIFNTNMPSGTNPIGVYFIGGSSTGNILHNNKIFKHFLGVVFQSSYTSSNRNKVRNTKIYDNKCDGVTFSGFGVADNNDIYRNGFDCENDEPTPVPGAGIYAVNNSHGAEITNNELWDNCGHNIDLDRVANFEIEGNEADSPGYQWGGTYTYCGGAASLALIDSRDNDIHYNSFTNSGRPDNRAEFNGTFKEASYPSGGTYFQDFPHGSRQVFAFFMGERRNATNYTTDNSISNNVFRAYCTPTTTCVGIGFFASRNTGYDGNSSWHPTLFTSNNVYGSQYGSRRCGGNWYAGNSTCTQNPTDPACNNDDYQHNAPVGDDYRNDKCWTY